MAILRLGIALFLGLVAIGLLLLGLLLIAWGFERWLCNQIGPVDALLLTGLVLLLMSGGMGWLASRQIR